MGTKKTLQFLVPGGKATAGPPIGPALGPLGVNVMAVVNKVNELTKDFAGMQVPVKVTVDVDTKEFEVEVGVPTTSALIIKEAKAQKGSGEPGRKYIGNLTMEQVIKIALTKREQLKSKTLKGAVKQVLGSCLSMGVTVEGKNPKEVIKEVNEGIYDELLKKYEEGG
ncbi:MAG: 50S ribosomal protein L11 [Thermoprotei archaeon]|nr:MAG: 50S ribosomal protein L11 [Thermoprotei archaeon]RLF00486.1 MAG: 50S ribosomal protein L11 [Thermoprotei archaeon]